MTIDCIPELFKSTVNLIVKESRRIIEDGRELAPIAFLCRSDGIFPVVLDFPDEQGKDTSSEMITFLAKKFHPEYIVFVSEAWMLKTNLESDKKRDKSQSLEHHPDRIDAVMYSLETKYGIWLGNAEIKTVNNKRTVEMANFSKPDKATGRFTNLLVHSD